MQTENIPILQIHKLTQAQYDRELAAGNIDENALYLTPDEDLKSLIDEIDAMFDAHKHTVTHTPAGSIGSKSLTPAGSVSSTFTGSSATTGSPSGTTSVYSITGVGSVPSLTASVTNRCLTLTFSAGSVPTRSSVTLPSTAHTHTVTAKGSVSSTFTGTAASHNHTFTGTSATLTTSVPKE